jgi:predicted DNA-binding protein
MIPKRERKVNQLRVRLTPSERNALEILAARDGRSASEMIRELIRVQAKSKGIAEIAFIGLLDKNQERT